jgi:hypothetical protein
LGASGEAALVLGFESASMATGLFFSFSKNFAEFNSERLKDEL